MESESLSAEDSRRLLDLARACKAATRIVSLYPPSHPTIQAALARITDAGTHAVVQGPFTLTVEPDTLTLGGVRLARPDTAVNELAALLHSHRVGALTLEGRLTPAAWHSFLMLLAQAPEEIRSEGGISAAWANAGGGPLAIREIDYALVLREGTGGTPVLWDRVVQDFLQSESGVPSPAALGSLMSLATQAGRLAEFLPQALTVATEQGIPLRRQQQQLAQLMQGLARHAATAQPAQLDAVLDNMAAALPSLAPEFVTALLSARRAAPPQAAEGAETAPAADAMDLAAALRPRLDEAAIARFVASTLARERSASGRLAEAFQALVPDKTSHERILAQAEALVEDGAVGGDPALPSLWQDAARLLTSYSDEDYISDSYASDLTKARDAAVELDRISDDPPERIAAWIASVRETDVRELDHALVLDLLAAELRPEPWGEALAVATAHLETLVPAGDFTRAQQVIDRLRELADDRSSAVAPRAGDAIRQLATGTVGRLAVSQLKQAPERVLPVSARLCQSLGPDLITVLVDGIVSEGNVQAVRRLREAVLAFGPAARDHVDTMLASTQPSVRRIAIEIIRAVGGVTALPNVAQLLEDTDALVQREAVRTVLDAGTDDGFALLHATLTGGPAPVRDSLMAGLGLLRDARAAKLFAYLLRRTDHRTDGEDRVLAVIRLIGNTGAAAPESAEALGDVLRRGEWWAPGRTRRLRTAAAEVLGAARAEHAVATLRAVAADGPRGARRIARATLAETGR